MKVLFIFDEDFASHPFKKMDVCDASESYQIHLLCRYTEELQYNLPTSLGKLDLRYLPSRADQNRLDRNTLCHISSAFTAAVAYLTVLMRIFQLLPDVIVLDSPRLSPPVLFLKPLLRFELIYHPYELFGHQSFKVALLWRFIESFVFLASSVLITQSELRCIYYKSRASSTKLIISYNTKPRIIQRVEPRSELLDRLPDSYFIYEGSLIPGRNISTIVRHFIDDRNSNLVIAGRMSHWFQELCNELNIDSASNISYVGYQSSEAISILVSRAKAGFISYDNMCLNNRLSAPGRISDYLDAETPLIYDTANFSLDLFLRQEPWCFGCSFNEPYSLPKTLQVAKSFSTDQWIEYANHYRKRFRRINYTDIINHLVAS